MLNEKELEAFVEEVITPSPQRVQPRCKYFGTCGGCKQQDLDYKHQTAHKQEQVEDMFKHDGGFKDLSAGKAGFEIENILPSENTFYYKIKWSLHFLICNG